MKRKIGTVIDDSLYNDIGLLAAQEGRCIAEVVRLALHDYVQTRKVKKPLKQGLTRFLESPPFNLTNEQVRESLEVDYFDQ